MPGRFATLRRRLFSESSVDKEYFQRNVEHQAVEDITMNIFYQSRSLTVLFLITFGLTYFAFTRLVLYYFYFPYCSPADLPLSDCLFNGAIVAVTVFLIISTMIMPNGEFFSFLNAQLTILY